MGRATDISNEEKEDIYRFPPPDVVGFGRHLSCAATPAGLWTAVQHAVGRTCSIALKGPTGTEILPTTGHALQPVLAAAGDRLGLAWTAAAEGDWQVGFRGLAPATPPVTVASQSGPLQWPALLAVGATWYLAWAAPVAGVSRIHLARGDGDCWECLGPVSAPDVPANRPCLSAVGDRVLIAWDGYQAPDFRIHWRFLDGPEASFGAPGERWFRATLAGDLAAWLVLEPVTDARGIVDWQPSIRATTLPAGPVETVADLRPGLLAHVSYKGYSGRRRHPQLCRVGDRTWLCWEFRDEQHGDVVAGWLGGRERRADGTWAPPVRLTHSGYAYAVPAAAPGPGLPVAHLTFETRGLDVIRQGEIDLAGEPLAVDPADWAQWHVAAPPPLEKPTRTVDVDGTAHHFFWADTHCHTNRCPDAEGEPDELIHLARDLAGLDALCLIDNDFYPHKAFTPAEWLLNQELARQYTEAGRFVLFPGYEYTGHERRLHPDFNHRCVLFPRPPGDRCLFRRIDAESDTAAKMVACLRETAGMCYPHHPTFEWADPACEWLAEVCSSWRVVIEETDFARRQLLAGRRFGFVGSSDSHRANAGFGGALTGILAPELTPEALFAAYRQRRTIATQGFAMYVDFRVAGRLIGGEAAATGAVPITGVVETPEPIEFVEVRRDDEPIRRLEPGGAACTFDFTDDPGPGDHFYHLRLKLVGDPGYNIDPASGNVGPFALQSRFPHNLARARGVFAWTSPIWLTRA